MQTFVVQRNAGLGWENYSNHNDLADAQVTWLDKINQRDTGCIGSGQKFRVIEINPIIHNVED